MGDLIEAGKMSRCPRCGSPMAYIPQYGMWYCYYCKAYQQPYYQHPYPNPPTQSQYSQEDDIWHQNHYRLRKKVLAIANKYWIEDYNGNILGFSKQKILKLKEDIRIYKDESMSTEIFRIKQQQILDAWGRFAVIDSSTNALLGYIKRKWLKSAFAWDEWDVLDANGNLIGGVHEDKGLGLVRKYVPGGGLVPEKMTLKLNGIPVAEINQQFKIIGDIWDVNCINVPPYFDRRVLLGGALLMAMIERSRK